MNYQPDNKLSLKTLIRGFAAHVKDDAGHDTGILKSFYPDSELVKIAQTRLGKQYTEDAIRKARRRQGIERCTTWGADRLRETPQVASDTYIDVTAKRKRKIADTFDQAVFGPKKNPRSKRGNQVGTLSSTQ